MATDKVIRCTYISEDSVNIPNHGFGQTLWDAMEKKRDAVALVEVGENGNRLTYAELMTRAELVACRLLSLGCQQRDVIAIFAPNSVDWVIVCLAALRIGAVTAAINSLLKEDELKHQLTISSARFVFTDVTHIPIASSAVKGLKTTIALMSGVDEKLKESAGCVDIGRQLDVGESVHRLPSFDSLHITLDQLVFIFFSSGTTGLQKGVMLSHRNMQYEFIVGTIPECTAIDEVQLAFAPLSHVTGSFVTLFGLGSGSKTFLMKRFEPELFCRTIHEEKIKRLVVVPPLATMLAKSPLTDKYPPTHLKDLLCGAAPLSAEVEDILIQRIPGLEIRQVYGMTETCGAVTITLSKKSGKSTERKPGTVGVALPTVSLKIIDSQTGEILGPNTTGEVCIKSPLVMLGYLGNPEATAATIDSDGWLHSGDLGYYDKDEHFYIVDRVKELIKYNAYQVAPAELEAVLLSHSDVADAAVVGLPDESAGELPLAWVVKKPQATITERQLQQFVDEKVAAFKRLRGGVQFVAAIPKTASGKILRREMKEALKTNKGKQE